MFLKQTIGGAGLSSPGPRTGKLALPSQVVSSRDGGAGRQGWRLTGEGGARGEKASSFCSLEFFSPY